MKNSIQNPVKTFWYYGLSKKSHNKSPSNYKVVSCNYLLRPLFILHFHSFFFIFIFIFIFLHIYVNFMEREPSTWSLLPFYPFLPGSEAMIFLLQFNLLYRSLTLIFQRSIKKHWTAYCTYISSKNFFYKNIYLYYNFWCINFILVMCKHLINYT